MKEGIKTFINNSGKDLTVTLYIRDGGAPGDIGATQVFPLAKGARERVVYQAEPGQSGYAFLDGLLIEDASSRVDRFGVSQRIIQRDSPWDNTLNTNNTITIDGLDAGSMNVSGSNS